MTEKENKKRKHKKSLHRVERELMVEAGKLDLIGMRAGVAMFKTAMKLERKRQPGRYVS